MLHNLQTYWHSCYLRSRSGSERNRRRTLCKKGATLFSMATKATLCCCYGKQTRCALTDRALLPWVGWMRVYCEHVCVCAGIRLPAWLALCKYTLHMNRVESRWAELSVASFRPEKWSTLKCGDSFMFFMSIFWGWFHMLCVAWTFLVYLSSLRLTWHRRTISGGSQANSSCGRVGTGPWKGIHIYSM